MVWNISIFQMTGKNLRAIRPLINRDFSDNVKRLGDLTHVPVAKDFKPE